MPRQRDIGVEPDSGEPSATPHQPATGRIAEPAPGSVLSVVVVNGNLRFVREPLLLGHYRSVALTGTECVVDDLIGGVLRASLALGQYPEASGTQQVFLNANAHPTNPLQLPRPEAVIVVGLGDEGALRATDLTRSVRQGVVAWAQRLRERAGGAPGPVAPGPFALAATLVGSGGTGVSAGRAARQVVQGVVDANCRLTAAGWSGVSRLSLIELYLDRAAEAWRALRAPTAASAGYVIDDVIHTGVGPLQRPLSASYRGAAYDLISATTVAGERGDEAIAYVLDTKRARTEVRAQATQGPLLRELVVSASNAASDERIGRTLFRLLVPPELEPFLGGTTEMVLDVDRGTAGIPWELLDTATGADDDREDARPWAIRAKLLRKLRTANFRPQVVDADAGASVLVIGEPACDPAYPRLLGARAEAEAVAALFARSGVVDPARVLPLVSPDPARPGADARGIINALLERDWRVVHIAGHGAPPEQGGDAPDGGTRPRGRAGDPRGVVLSNGTFLGPREIGTMRTVPDLVFVNCCHLAARDADELLGADDGGALHYDRAGFAATVAESLIGIGVRCVVAAGWAVADDAAKVFATTFYGRLLASSRFVDAVTDARVAARALGGNTWAAYQCYGDPNWALARDEAGATTAPVAPKDLFANVASPTGLRVALETLAVNSRYEPAERATAADRIRYLEAHFGGRWGDLGAVAEAFGTAWAEHDVASAVTWYARALAANDGGASLGAAEQWGNLRARRAWEAVADGAPTPDALEAARDELSSALACLKRLTELQSTIERESLCGSAWKRWALLEDAAGRSADAAEAVTHMKACYAKAEALARAAGHPALFYPALNRMAGELVVDAGAPGWPGFDAAATEAVRASLTAKARDDPDFWSVAGLVELRLYEAVARGALADAAASLAGAYADLYRRVDAGWLWASVRDQLRFVLPRYAARAPDAERRAGDALGRLVAGYAAGVRQGWAPPG